MYATCICCVLVGLDVQSTYTPFYSGVKRVSRGHTESAVSMVCVSHSCPNLVYTQQRLVIFNKSSNVTHHWCDVYWRLLCLTWFM